MSTAARPAWCGDPACDPGTRLVDTPDGPARCPRCHPLSPTTLGALRTREAQLQQELAEVQRRIADHETAAGAPPWVRGPGLAGGTR